MLRSCEGKTSRGTCIECEEAQLNSIKHVELKETTSLPSKTMPPDVKAGESSQVSSLPLKSKLLDVNQKDDERSQVSSLPSKTMLLDINQKDNESPQVSSLPSKTKLLDTNQKDAERSQVSSLPSKNKLLDLKDVERSQDLSLPSKTMLLEEKEKDAESSQVSSLTSSTTSEPSSMDLSVYDQVGENEAVGTTMDENKMTENGECSFDFCCAYPKCKADQFDECKVCTKRPAFCELHLESHEHEVENEFDEYVEENDEMDVEDEKEKDNKEISLAEKEAEVNNLWINKMCCSRCKLNIDSDAKSQKCATGGCHRIIHVDCIELVKNNGHCFDCCVLFPNKLNSGRKISPLVPEAVSNTKAVPTTSEEIIIPAKESSSSSQQSKSVDLTIKSKKSSTRKDVLKETYEAYLSAELVDDYETEADFFEDIQTRTKEERLQSLQHHNKVIQNMCKLEEEQFISDYFSVPSTDSLQERLLTKINFKLGSKFYCSERTYFTQDDPEFPLTLLYGYWSCDGMIRHGNPGHMVLSYTMASHPLFKPNSVAIMRVVQTTCNAPWVGIFICNVKSALSPSGPNQLSFQILQNKEKNTIKLFNEICCDYKQPVKHLPKLLEAFRFHCGNEKILYNPKRHLKIDCVKHYYHDTTAKVLDEWEKQQVRGGKGNDNFFEGSFDPSINDVFATQEDINSGRVIIAVRDADGGYITKKVNKAEFSTTEDGKDTSDTKTTTSSSSSTKTRANFVKLGEICRISDLLEEKTKRRELAKENDANKASLVALKRSVEASDATIAELKAKITELEEANEKLQGEAEEQTIKTSSTKKRGRAPADVTDLKNKITQLKKDHNEVIAGMNVDKRTQVTLLKNSQDATSVEKKRADDLQKQLSTAEATIAKLKEDANKTTLHTQKETEDRQAKIRSSKDEITNLKSTVEEQTGVIAILKNQLAEFESNSKLEKDRADQRRSAIKWKGMRGWQFINGLINGSIKSGDVEQSSELACCLQQWIKDGFIFADQNQGGTFQIQTFASPLTRYSTNDDDDDNSLFTMQVVQQTYDTISPNFQRSIQLNRQPNYVTQIPVNQPVSIPTRPQQVYIQQQPQYQLVAQQQNGHQQNRKRARSHNNNNNNARVVYQPIMSNAEPIYL